MKIDKSKVIKDHQYIDDPVLNELREVAQAWSDRAGGQKIRNLVALLDQKLNDEWVKLPEDSEGEIWTGSESRMICYFDDKPDSEQPTDDKPAFCDGLVYSNGRWYVYSQNVLGTDFYIKAAEICRHVKKSPVDKIISDLGELSVQFMSEAAVRLRDDPDLNIIDLTNEYIEQLNENLESAREKLQNIEKE